jgi:hypothetical protein
MFLTSWFLAAPAASSLSLLTVEHSTSSSFSLPLSAKIRANALAAEASQVYCSYQPCLQYCLHKQSLPVAVTGYKRVRKLPNALIIGGPCSRNHFTTIVFCNHEKPVGGNHPRGVVTPRGTFISPAVICKLGQLVD